MIVPAAYFNSRVIKADQNVSYLWIERVVAMLRASFFAGGLFVIMLGISTMFVDKVVLHSKEDSRNDPNFRGFYTSVNEKKQHVFDPPDWAGFSLMSVGGVTILYSLALPKAAHH